MRSKKVQRIICIILALLLVVSIVAVAIPMAMAADSTGKLIPCIEENIELSDGSLKLVPSNGYTYGRVIQIGDEPSTQGPTRGAMWYSNYKDINDDPLQPIMLETGDGSETKSIRMNIGVAPWYFASEDDPMWSGYWLTGTAGVTATQI